MLIVMKVAMHLNSETTVSGPRPVWLDDKTKSITDRAIVREQSPSRLLTTYIITGLDLHAFARNVSWCVESHQISSREAADSISPAAVLLWWRGVVPRTRPASEFHSTRSPPLNVLDICQSLANGRCIPPTNG